MQARLSELLERIRPAGSPGAPADGARLQEDRHNRELAELAAVLAGYEEEARTTVEEARAEAVRVGREGAQRARDIRATLAARIADAEVATARSGDVQAAAAAAQFDADTQREVAELHRRANAELPGLVTEAVALVWNTFTLADPEAGQ